MSVLALGLALRTVNNGLGLIGQYLGLGLASALALAIGGLTLNVRASRHFLNRHE